MPEVPGPYAKLNYTAAGCSFYYICWEKRFLKYFSQNVNIITYWPPRQWTVRWHVLVQVTFLELHSKNNVAAKLKVLANTPSEVGEGAWARV